MAKTKKNPLKESGKEMLESMGTTVKATLKFVGEVAKAGYKLGKKFLKNLAKAAEETAAEEEEAEAETSEK